MASSCEIGPFRLMHVLQWFTTFCQLHLWWVQIHRQNHKVYFLKMLPLYHVPEGMCLCVFECVCPLKYTVKAGRFKQLQYWSCGLRRKGMKSWIPGTHAHTHTHIAYTEGPVWLCPCGLIITAGFVLSLPHYIHIHAHTLTLLDWHTHISPHLPIVCTPAQHIHINARTGGGGD